MTGHIRKQDTRTPPSGYRTTRERPLEWRLTKTEKTIPRLWRENEADDQLKIKNRLEIKE
ncbi:hypothetical protein FMN50_10135 [Rhodobacterales bacterium]|nr:hypothetical protein FMN50_10135 [Rhodobacterales bacterium]